MLSVWLHHSNIENPKLKIRAILVTLVKKDKLGLGMVD